MSSENVHFLFEFCLFENVGKNFISNFRILCSISDELTKLIATTINPIDNYRDRIISLQQRLEKQRHIHTVIYIIDWIRHNMPQLDGCLINEIWIDNCTKLVKWTKIVIEKINNLGDNSDKFCEETGVNPHMYTSIKQGGELLQEYLQKLIQNNGVPLLNFLVIESNVEVMEISPIAPAPDDLPIEPFWVGVNQFGLTNPFVDGSRNIPLTKDSPTVSFTQNQVVSLIDFLMNQ
jgi:hypothetical protein